MFDWLLLEGEIFLGLICVTFGFILALGVQKFTIPRIKLQISAYIFEQINSYVAGFLQNLQEHPEQAEAMIQPFIAAALKQIQTEVGSGPGSREKTINLFGFKIPMSLLSPLVEQFAGRFIKGKMGGSNQNSNSLLQLPEG